MVITLNTLNATHQSGPQGVLSLGSFILDERGARRHHWEGEGALSIKTFFHGQALYDVGKGRYAVDDRSYLILNHSQPYCITIDARRGMSSFCLFFEAGFAEAIFRSLTAAPQQLLDEPASSGLLPLNFFERTYPHDDILSPALRRLRASLVQRKNDAGWLQEQFHLIMQKLLQVHSKVRREASTLPALRAATREELYRRIHRAKDYMHAMFHQRPTLAEMAQVACLSPNHFLRTFKQAFHQTPHQYLTQLRLAHAQQLLAHTEFTVTEICFAVGCESLGSFSWLFRRRVGVSPEAYRRRSAHAPPPR